MELKFNGTVDEVFNEVGTFVLKVAGKAPVKAPVQQMDPVPDQPASEQPTDEEKPAKKAKAKKSKAKKPEPKTEPETDDTPVEEPTTDDTPVEEPEAVDAPREADTQSSHTLEDVRNKLSEVASAKGMDVARELLKEYSAVKISDVKPAQYGGFMAKCEELING